jgi:signal transduction histidine kinase
MPHKQIMLVDDEPRLLAALKRRLSSTFDIVTFERGQDALDYLSGPHNVAVIVADMQMPEMNGIELLTQVYAHDPDIRRIMLTGNSDQETATAAINDARVLRFIRKPCDALVLKDILLQALEEYEFNKANLSELVTAPVSDAALGQAHLTFLSVMSDELRTPLSQIITISGILSQNSTQTDPKTLENFLMQIHQSGESVLKHIDRVLRYTRLQTSNTDRDRVRTESFNIIAMIQDLVTTNEKSAKERLASISFEAPQETMMIQGFPREIASAFQEVIENAIKYTDVGGHVGIIFRFNDEKVVVRISNSSALEKHGRRLQSNQIFKHDNGGLDGSNSGIGLGLSLVRLIARRNEFLFDVQQGADGGGVVTFVFHRIKFNETTESLRLAS